MSKINTDEIREEYRTRHKDREWFEVWLQEALDEIDRLREREYETTKKAFDSTVIASSLSKSVEQRTKDAV